MAKPPLQTRIPIAEKAYIPPVVEAPTIVAMTPQYLPPFNRENLKFWFLQVEEEQVPASLYDVLTVNSDADLTTLALLTDRLFNKRKTKGTVSTTLGGVQSRLIIQDKRNNLSFLIDTGADISVLPLSTAKGNITPSDFKVYAADGTLISTYGVRTLILDLGLRRPYIWKFIVAKIQQPIIGADFLKYHGFLVDLKNRRIIDDYTKIQQIAQLSTVKHPTITTLNKEHNNV
ncbi:uncharacterized protein LOC122537312 [Frieseomelitta varia]|uniref:uncharacterized protein LOC122537312 n=1 Tax=Frieseomelitta varia TaxID=561572 RepID=UPI001CB67FED|nr:uncharacterized protein LOC122537312 [Frieseomelitta varia]